MSSLVRPTPLVVRTAPRRQDGRLFRDPANHDDPPLEVLPESSFAIWGVAAFLIHRT